MTARDKRAVAQLSAQQRFAKGQPPSAEVDAALKSFSAPPSPEQIAAVSMEFARKYGVAAAVEFETYAKGLVIDLARKQAEKAYQGGQAPQQATQQALAAFGGTPPTEEQIKAKSAELARKSPALAAEFEAFARGLLSERLAQQEGQYSERDVRTLEGDFDTRANTRYQGPPALPFGGGQPAPQASQAQPPAPSPAPAPRQGYTPPPSGSQEKSLLEHAKETLQGAGSILTLGYIPMPESVKRGHDRFKQIIGDEEEEKADGGTEKPRASR